jgi:predicted DNA-binding protein (UPF0251 family)/predicted Fe-Mo cluster-binding NifX family protein
MKPRVKRYARRLDSNRIYKPAGIKAIHLTKTIISLDEFEAMRLIDVEGYSQIEASEDMRVSRATIQRLLQSGRQKIISGILQQHVIEVINDTKNIQLKGENKMNKQEKTIKVIAFPTSDRKTVDGHFGHTKEFALYKMEENQVTDISFVTPPPHEPGVLPRFLGDNNVDVIITGGMGRMAIDLFHQQGIDVVLGATGSLDQNINEFLGGVLTSTGSACNHHHGEHHGH